MTCLDPLGSVNVDDRERERERQEFVLGGTPRVRLIFNKLLLINNLCRPF